MCVRKVGDVDVVSHASAVRRGIILTENADIVASMVGDLQNYRDKVRLGIVRLAYLTALVRACRVEIAQRHVFETVRLVVVLHKLLHHKLGLTVNTRRMLRALFRDETVTAISVRCRRRGKHKVFYATSNHSVQKRKRACHVVVIILGGIGHTLTDERERRKVNDGIHVIFLESGLQKFHIKDIALDERHALGHGFDMSGRKIVVYDNVHIALFEFSYAMRADIARSACNQNHIILLARTMRAKILIYALL